MVSLSLMPQTTLWQSHDFWRGERWFSSSSPTHDKSNDIYIIYETLWQFYVSIEVRWNRQLIKPIEAKVWIGIQLWFSFRIWYLVCMKMEIFLWMKIFWLRYSRECKKNLFFFFFTSRSTSSVQKNSWWAYE